MSVKPRWKKEIKKKEKKKERNRKEGGKLSTNIFYMIIFKTILNSSYFRKMPSNSGYLSKLSYIFNG